MKKKGQINTLQLAVITILVIGILLGIFFLLIDELKGNLATKTGTVEMEQIADMSNATSSYVEYNSTTADIPCWTSASLVASYNATDNSSVETGNFTFTTSTGAIKVSGWDYNGSTINVNYTYVYGDTGCENMETTEEAVQNIPTWLAIIVIMIIVGIIMAIVFKVLPYGRGSGTTAEI